MDDSRSRKRLSRIDRRERQVYSCQWSSRVVPLPADDVGSAGATYAEPQTSFHGTAKSMDGSSCPPQRKSVPKIQSVRRVN